MGLIISHKIKCNTIAFPTNKEEKPKVINIPSNKMALKYDDLGIVVLRPQIDKLVFGFSPTATFLKKYDPTQDVNAYKKHIKGSLFQDGKYSEQYLGTPVDGVTFVKGVSYFKKPYSSYNVNLYYNPPGSEERILIQIDPKNSYGNKTFMRFDMNPSLFSAEDIGHFKAFIEDLLLTVPETVPFADFMEACKIYRADIAVDILGARPSDFEVMLVKSKKPHKHKAHKYVSATGRLETIYPMALKGKPNTVYVYDKRTEQIEAGNVPIYGDILHSRFESRVEKTNIQKLKNIQNRCRRVTIRCLDLARYNELHFSKRLFIRLVLERDLQKALQEIPEKYKTEFEDCYEDAMQTIWDPKKIWSFWNETLTTSGLFPTA